MKHVNMTYVANVLRGIIALLLVAVIIILLVKSNRNDQVQIIPAAPVSVQSDPAAAPATTQSGSSENFVHPPAEGKFVTDAVKNFTVTYNKSTRMFSVSAAVLTSFTFEANLPYKVYDSKGVLIATGHTQVYGQDAQSQYDTHLSADLQFMIPNTIKENEILVFRFLADNASGLPEHDKYWGTTIRVK